MWTALKIPGRAQTGGLPGDRGRYLLRLSPPWVEGESHYVHFSWLNESFCLRDYVNDAERRQSQDATATTIWHAAEDRIPATGEFFVPVENHEFWTSKLKELSVTSSRAPFAVSGRPSIRERLGNDMDAAAFGTKSYTSNEDDDESLDVYERFRRLWKSVPGFEIVDGTVGYSARYRREPLLWIYPTRFQVAPEGKGNAHEADVRRLRNSHFPEMATKGLIGFGSAYFSWERLEALVEDLRHLVTGR